jgi:hypothetical protein
MHDREWYALICHLGGRRSTGNATRSAFQRMTKNMPVKWNSRALADDPISLHQFEINSRRRYFILGASDVELETLLAEEDTPNLVQRGKQISFGYPGYISCATSGKLAGALMVLLPYSGLAREFWQEHLLPAYPTAFEFTRADVGALVQRLQKHEQDTANIQLKLGRALVHNDPNARVVTLRGQNILDSNVYRLLFGSRAERLGLSFDDTYSRVGYYPVEGHSLTIFVDRYGNLRLRPGRFGINSFTALRFLQQAFELRLLSRTNYCPILRLTTDEDM